MKHEIFNHNKQNIMTEQQDSIGPEAPSTSITFGEKLAGVSFNPSNDSHVDLVKSAAAKFMDAIENADWGNFKNGQVIPDDHIAKQIMQQAKLRALEAQMLAVKAITWKY